jgi:4-alpha-glucanotransferase
LARFQLVLLIHAHQPVGNFPTVLEDAYAQSYLPFVETLQRHPGVRIGLHFSGSLLEWLGNAHPEYFETLRVLSDRGQIELVGGGFYEPILIAIPPHDRHEQIHQLADFLEKHFGKRPEGAWLAERVWEPCLPSTLAACGVKYTLVDDHHFLTAGFESAQLCGDYLAEDLGAAIRLIPGWKSLRYLIPYRTVKETVDYLQGLANEHPGGMVAMGDDCEKFGVWPGTHKHCYEDGWLEEFFAGLEAASSWLEAVTPAQALASRPPLGRADLPNASYAEMSSWSLPTEARERYELIEKEFESRPDVKAFLSGGIWRNFFSKYSESNLLHMKMLRASKRVHLLFAAKKQSSARRARLKEIQRLVLRAQCNDAYWHGVFGGLYSPHLRTELWRSLVAAESLLARVEHGRREFVESSRGDFSATGREEILMESRRYAAVIMPADGGTISALDFRPSGATLINSLMRRREAYHSRLQSAQAGGETSAVSIHERTRAKEYGLADRLRYDQWQRHAFRLLLFNSKRSLDDYQNLRLEEAPSPAGGAFDVIAAGPEFVQLKLSGDSEWAVQKEFKFASSHKDGFDLTCASSLTNINHRTDVLAGIEIVLNLLAPNAADRFFETSQGRHPLQWTGSVPASEFAMVDEWQGVRILLLAPGAQNFWVAPIETISESEDGFERVYQGSQILAVWKPDFSTDKPWTAQIVLRVTK